MPSDYCSNPAYVNDLLRRILTQYRESPNLLAVIRKDLEAIGEAASTLCMLPEEFDIATAVGDQLTIIGKWLGFPRCHCICETPSIFGFDCDQPTNNPNRQIVGFCEDGTWVDCVEANVGETCITDDEVYRRYLYARIFQILKLYDLKNLRQAVREIWGAQALAINMGGARVAIVPARVLTDIERLQLAVAFRVLPFAPGIETYVDFSTGPIFGFGEGWGGFCEGANWFCPEPFDAYVCA